MIFINIQIFSRFISYIVINTSDRVLTESERIYADIHILFYSGFTKSNTKNFKFLILRRNSKTKNERQSKEKNDKAMIPRKQFFFFIFSISKMQLTYLVFIDIALTFELSTAYK